MLDVVPLGVELLNCEQMMHTANELPVSDYRASLYHKWMCVSTLAGPPVVANLKSNFAGVFAP